MLSTNRKRVLTKQEQYIEMYRHLHRRENNFPGASTAKHVGDIASLIKETNSKTLLDYGCGKGTQYTKDKVHGQWGGILPTLYDPAVPQHSKKPNGLWDGVLCVDVMEHIPEEAVQDVLFDVIARARRFVFFNVSRRPAGLRLPNGKNAHVTIKEHDWWEQRIKSVKRSLGSNAIVFLESRKHTDEEIIGTRV